jgi:hypothetical protein
VKSCLTCVHAQFIQPADWVPRYSGQPYEHHQVEERMRHTGHAQRLNCTLNPTWVEFNTNHWCAQWLVHDRLSDNYTAYRRWRMESEEAQKENKRLRAELKEARRRSKARMARLKKLERE